jgi:integrase
MWINSKGFMQEYVVDAHTGMKKIVSVKVMGKTKKAEQEAYTKLQDRVRKLTETRYLMSDVVRLYLKEHQKVWKPSSHLRTSSHFKQILSIVDGYMNELTAGYIRTKLVESGKSNRTVNDYQRTIKTFWRWAYRCDYVNTQEVADKLLALPDQPKRERIQDKYLEPWEIKKLLGAIPKEYENFALMVRFQILTGMRIGEAIALNDKDVWGSVIHITKTYDTKNRIVTEPKSLKSRRDIHIQPELKECVDNIRRYEHYQREIFGYSTDLFFPCPEGSFFDYQKYNNYIGQLTEEVLGRRLTPHAFRHTHCSLLCGKLTLDEIAARLGHEDSRITRAIYMHRTEELKKKEAEKLDKITLLG